MQAPQITPFQFDDHEVRTLLIDGEPWFVVVDLCKALGIINPSDAVKRLDGDERMTLDLTDGHSNKRGGAQSQRLRSFGM